MDDRIKKLIGLESPAVMRETLKEMLLHVFMADGEMSKPFKDQVYVTYTGLDEFLKSIEGDGKALYPEGEETIL
jgi:hypothetical protein